MDNNELDLNAYSEAFTHYRPRIEQSLSVEEASGHAAGFLGEVTGMFDRDIKTAFHQETEYLWTTFPSRARTLAKYRELVAVLLGQAVDFYWYAQCPQYHSEQDVQSDKALYSFGRFHEDFEVKFQYVQYYGHLFMRVPNSLRLRYRRLVNHPGKYTQGLTTTRCKKAMVGLINQIAEEVALELDSRKTFKILVNSVLRTVEYQDSLARIGYVAPRHSGHLAGYAVDVEKLWYAENDPQAHAAIARTVGDLFHRGTINLIEEGTHWHVCLNPDQIPTFEALAARWGRKE